MASPLLVLLLFLIPVVVLLLRRRRAASASSRRPPPEPKGLPLIGNLHQLASSGGSYHRTLWRFSLKEGPIFTLKLGSVRTTVICSAELAKEVLKSKDLDLCSRTSSASTDAYSMHGKGIVFAPYSDQWRVLKKISIVELFSAMKVRSFAPAREQEISALMQSLAASAATDASRSAAVNLSEAVAKVTSSFVCRVAFGGTDAGGVGDQQDSGQLINLFKLAQRSILAPYVADYFPALAWIDRITGAKTELEKSSGNVFNLIEKMVLDHMRRREVALPEQEDLVDVLLRIQKEEGNLTMDDIKVIVTDIFLAGSETSFAAVIWTMAELMQHPAIMKKAQDEVRKVVGAKRKIDEHDVLQLQYLNCVIKETFRLHPPVPLLPARQCMRDVTIGGYDVPQGRSLLVNVFAVGRDPKAWDEPEKFNPERFMGSKRDVDFKGQDFELLPFGSGRRICPGMFFGATMVEQLVTNLLYWFDWQLPEGMKIEDLNMDEAPGLTVHKKAHLRLVPVKPKLD